MKKKTIGKILIALGIIEIILVLLFVPIWWHVPGRFDFITPLIYSIPGIILAIVGLYFFSKSHK